MLNYFVKAIWSKVENLYSKFFPAASTLEIFTWNLIFQIVIELIVYAEQMRKKSNNDNWIWNAWSIDFLDTLWLILIHEKFWSKNDLSAETSHTFCFWVWLYIYIK